MVKKLLNCIRRTLQQPVVKFKKKSVSVVHTYERHQLVILVFDESNHIEISDSFKPLINNDTYMI